MFFKALLMLETWELLSSMKCFLLSSFVGIITCFLDGPFIVILIWVFDNFLNVFDVFHFESREHFFDFEDFLSIAFCWRSLSIRFTRICLSLGWFCCLEIFGDLFDLFGRFYGDRRRNLLNTCQLVSIFFSILTVLGRSDSWGELMCNFLSESVIMTISKE